MCQRMPQPELTQEMSYEVLCALAAYCDPETGRHRRRAQYYMRVLAQVLQSRPKYLGNLSDATIDVLSRSAPLHNVGKVGTRISIPLELRELTPEAI